MFRYLTRLCVVLTLASFYALVPYPSPAHAQALTPPPPPGAICQTTGNGIFCHGAVTDSETNVDTGISCGTFELLESFTVRTTYELQYSTDGLGTQGTFHDNI